MTAINEILKKLLGGACRTCQLMPPPTLSIHFTYLALLEAIPANNFV